MDQVHDPLSDTLAVQVGNPVFGHDIVYVPSRRDHSGTFGQVRHNPGNLPFFSGRRHRNYRFAPPAARRTSDEIHLSTDAAVELIA